MNRAICVLKFQQITKQWKSSKLLLLFLCVCFASVANSQARRQLEEKRQKLLKDIKVTSQILKSTSARKEAALDKFLTLQTQVNTRSKLIKHIQQEITYNDQSVERTESVIKSLKNDLKLLEANYGKLARQAYRFKKTNNNLAFLFATKHFNQTLKRWQFLKRYSDYRKKQAQLIIATRKTLQKKVKAQEDKNIARAMLLENEENEISTLREDMLTKDSLLKILRADEARLGKDLVLQQSQHENLNKTIEQIIHQEIVEKRRAARTYAGMPTATNVKTANTKPKATIPAAAENVVLSRDFQKNRGKLPFPVSNGVISKYFGEQAHPTLKNVKVKNNGINIQTQANTPVTAVFDGVVTGVQYVPGYDYTVIVQHGKFYTVYSNINQVTINKGASISTGQSLGVVSTHPTTQTSELHFEVWIEKRHQNPLHWLKR